MRRAAVTVGAAMLGLLAAGCGGTKTVTVQQTVTHVVTQTTTQTVTTGGSSTAGACAGSDLSGVFAVIPGSAGAGQIVYRLRLTNTSASQCYVSGLPVVQLLDSSGAQLPTHVRAARPGTGIAARIVLAAGKSTFADARFSPDVPGQGDQQGPQCQPKAVTLRVSAPGGGTVDSPIRPATSVCEQGTLSFTLYQSAS